MSEKKESSIDRLVQAVREAILSADRYGLVGPTALAAVKDALVKYDTEKEPYDHECG